MSNKICPVTLPLKFGDMYNQVRQRSYNYCLVYLSSSSSSSLGPVANATDVLQP